MDHARRSSGAHIDIALRIAMLAGLILIAGCGGSVADSDSLGPSRSTAASAGGFCAAVRANSDAARPLAGLADGDAAPDGFPAVAAEVRRTGADVLTAAPAEIRADVERSVEATNLQLDALEAAGGDPVAAARNTDLTDRLTSAEYTEAGQRVRAYVARTCGTGGR
ncbi:MAG: hypothetical protein ACRDRH_05110 [Pseudonocardia sp.]